MGLGLCRGGRRRETSLHACLASGVSTVGEDGLSGDPPSVTDEEPDQGHDVSRVGQAGLGVLRQVCRVLIELGGLLGLPAVEERRLHGSGRDGVDRDPAAVKIFGCCTGEVLHGCLRPGVDRVQAGVGRQQRSDQRNELSPFGEMLSRLLDEEQRRLGVDRENLVEVLFGDVRPGAS